MQDRNARIRAKRFLMQDKRPALTSFFPKRHVLLKFGERVGVRLEAVYCSCRADSRTQNAGGVSDVRSPVNHDVSG